LAGGTDLWVDLRSGKKQANLVIDLKQLPELSGVREREDETGLGALLPIHSLESLPALGREGQALREAASALGSYQVRNRATLGGNLGNGAPTADMAAALIALDAVLELWRPDGSGRRVAVTDFWRGAGKTCLGPQEVICRVWLPRRVGWSSAFLKQGPRRAMDIAIVNAAVSLKTVKGVIADARVALGGAGATPLRPVGAEAALVGQKPSMAIFRRAGELAAEVSDPRGSGRASREYRLSLIPVLTERALTLAAERLTSQDDKKVARVK
jgi:carbon-monoxide dehydrogenase medium subunit